MLEMDRTDPWLRPGRSNVFDSADLTLAEVRRLAAHLLALADLAEQTRGWRGMTTAAQTADSIPCPAGCSPEIWAQLLATMSPKELVTLADILEEKAASRLDIPCPAWCTMRPGHGWDDEWPDGRQIRGHQGPYFGAHAYVAGTEFANQPGVTVTDIASVTLTSWLTSPPSMRARSGSPRGRGMGRRAHAPGQPGGVRASNPIPSPRRTEIRWTLGPGGALGDARGGSPSAWFTTRWSCGQTRPMVGST